jgi:hypothetical protein
LKRNFQEKIFACTYISLPIKFTTLLATPLVFQVKLFPGFRTVKNTWNLRCTLIFSSEKCGKRWTLNSK